MTKKLTYSSIFNYLYLLTVILVLSIPFVLLIKTIKRDINPFVSYHFDFSKPLPIFLEYNPRDVRGEVMPYAKFEDEINIQFKQNQAHYTIKLPSLFEQIKIKVTFSAEAMEEVNLKLPSFDQPEPLERYPLYNELLNNLSWPKISNGSFSLYQRSEENRVYQTIEEFFNQPPYGKKIGFFANRELPFANGVDQQKLKLLSIEDKGVVEKLDYLITNYQSPQQKGAFFINEYQGEISQEAIKKGKGAEYKFYIEGYGEKPNSKVQIKSLDITFIRPRVNFMGFLSNLVKGIFIRQN